MQERERAIQDVQAKREEMAKKAKEAEALYEALKDSVTIAQKQHEAGRARVETLERQLDVAQKYATEQEHLLTEARAEVQKLKVELATRPTRRAVREETMEAVKTVLAQVDPWMDWSEGYPQLQDWVQFYFESPEIVKKIPPPPVPALESGAAAVAGNAPVGSEVLVAKDSATEEEQTPTVGESVSAAPVGPDGLAGDEAVVEEGKADEEKEAVEEEAIAVE